MKRLFIVTGEYSGDKHAGDVVKELRKINPDIEIEAIGGVNLKSQGVKLFADHSKMSAMGIGFLIILNHIILGKRIASYLKNVYKPDMVLLVDYGGFNLNLSKIISKYGFKVYYYIPPQIWASRKWRLNTVKKCINKVITIFPFEKEMYDKANVNSEFVGHPLIKQLPEACNKEKLREELNINNEEKLVSIFPGSRVFEINNLLEIFLKSAQKIKEKDPNVKFALAQAPTIKDELINPIIKKYSDLNIKILKNRNYDLLSGSDALILASGTVALEAALYETPMIISYKGPELFYMIYKMVRCINMVSLPNIILNEEIVPELIQKLSNPEKISEEILKILNDENYRTYMKLKLRNVKEKMMSSNAAEKAALIINSDI